MQKESTQKVKELREFASYADLQMAHQKDVNEFPIVYLFGRKTDEELKKELEPIGAKSLEECVSLGAGAVIREEDVPAWIALCKRHEAERKHFSKTEDNLVKMIYSEMCNHEYGYTGDNSDTLRALGKTESDLETDERFFKAWKKAEKRCFARA